MSSSLNDGSQGQPRHAVTTGPEVSRREIISAGSCMALAAVMAPPAAAAPGTAPRVRQERSFDESWLFMKGDLPGAEAIAFDDAGWRTVDLPHDWRIEDLPGKQSDDGRATADPSLYLYLSDQVDPAVPRRIGPFDIDADPAVDTELTVEPLGRIVIPGGRGQAYTVGDIGWYRKRFTLPAGPGQQVELRFDGVCQNADIWLNGVHLGFNAHPYLSFAFDLTPHLRPGAENVLAVRVNDRGKTSRWYTGSGIYRHSWLTVTGPLRVPLWGVSVTTPQVSTANAQVKVALDVENRADLASVAVRVTLLNSRGRTVARRDLPAQPVAGGATTAFEAELAITRPALWSPETPTRYVARCEIIADGKVVDRTDTRFGIRSIAFDDKGFRLNGKTYFMNGGNIHHDHGCIGAIAIDRAEERTIEIMKAAGFNSIRGAHNPLSPAMLDACDRLGMLVYEEFTDRWAKAKMRDDYSNYFPTHWQRDLTTMIKRDRNHPSIILWSIGNEILEDPDNYGPKLAAHLKSLDPTRPVALGGVNIGKRPTDANTYTDVADYHYSLPKPDNPKIAGKAVIQSENGSGGIYDDWKISRQNPAYAGSWTWAGWDYMGEAGTGAPALYRTPKDIQSAILAGVTGRIAYPWYVAACGDIDVIGQRKPQNYWRSVVYGLSPLEVMVERPTPEGLTQIAAFYSYYDELESWTWDVPVGRPMIVRVYTGGDSVTILLNGKSIATKAVAETDKRRIAINVPYETGKLEVVASKDGKEIARKTLETAGLPAALRLRSDVPRLTTSRSDLAHVLVEVVDAQGRLVPDALVHVSCSAAGAGELIGMGNANPHNVDSFRSGRRWTWHGKALAVLRPAKRGGVLSLTATAPGLRPARLSLSVVTARD